MTVAPNCSASLGAVPIFGGMALAGWRHTIPCHIPGDCSMLVAVCSAGGQEGILSSVRCLSWCDCSASKVMCLLNTHCHNFGDCGERQHFRCRPLFHHSAAFLEHCLDCETPSQTVGAVRVFCCSSLRNHGVGVAIEAVFVRHRDVVQRRGKTRSRSGLRCAGRACRRKGLLVCCSRRFSDLRAQAQAGRRELMIVEVKVEKSVGMRILLPRS